MKKYYVALSIIVLAIAGIFLYPHLKTLAASYWNEVFPVSSATTTPAYLTVGNATSTYTVTIADADTAWMYLNAVASSTQTRYDFTYEWSTNNIDFYPMLLASTTYAADSQWTYYSSSTSPYSWTPGRTATATAAVKLPEGVGRYLRINLNVRNANGSLWFNFIPKMYRY